MKKPLPVPVLAVIGILAVAVLGFFFVRATAGPPEFAEPKRAPNYQEGIPDYIKNGGKGPIPGAPPAGQAPGQTPGPGMVQAPSEHPTGTVAGAPK